MRLNVCKTVVAFAIFTMLVPCNTWAAVIGDYCITPPFIQESVNPNLLLLIDNSSSMFDLAFADKGKQGTCSVTTSKTCLGNAGCPTGETCVNGREPYYCYDQTYQAGNTYVGYFDRFQADGVSTQYYSYDFTNNIFNPVATFSCVAGAGETAKSISNQLCLIQIGTSSVTKFLASGNYLNWLTASKFDVEKQVLTGGKYVSNSFLQAESRGCVGQGFIKDTLTADFINYASPASNNTNTQLAVTFSTHGPVNPLNITAPSAGGQTYIDIFSSNKQYDYASCQAAVDILANTTASNADVKQTVAACLAGSSSGYCQNNIGISCFATFPDCSAPTVKVCSGLTSKTCASNSDCTGTQGTCINSYFCEAADGSKTNLTCTTVGRSGQCPSNSLMCDEIIAPATTAAVTPNIACPTAGSTTGCRTPPTYWCDWGAEWMSNAHAAAPNSGGGGYTCDAVMTADPACSVQSTQQGKCSLKPQTSCNVDSDCSAHGNGVCVGFKGNGSHNCIAHTPLIDHGTCNLINGASNGVCGAQADYGSCIFGATTIATKVKVNFQQTMQACWQYNRFTRNVSGGADIGIDDVKTLDRQCSDIYNGSGSTAPYMTCSNNHNKTCTTLTAAADCGGGSCTDGPDAIAPGYPALICGTAWEGQLYTKSNGVWIKKGSFNDSTTKMSGGLACTPDGTYNFTDCMKVIHRQFCGANQAPPVTDPTDAPSDTASFDNLPAILSGIAVEAQMGQPIMSNVAVKVAKNTAPTGVVQDFSQKIRMGVMSFNFVGSGYEVTNSSVAAPKVCSNNSSQICTASVDCGTGNTCAAAATNLDGSKMLYYIGQGTCSTTSSTMCAKDSHCPTGETCLSRTCSATTTTKCDKDAMCPSGETCLQNSAGDHTAGMINIIDNIVASSWTPFAESFYNAIGYFAVDKTRDPTNLKYSRANSSDSANLIRLNTGDFVDNMNPSVFACQDNNILLITDGSSTMDQNSTVNALAGLYHAPNNQTGACTNTGINYYGSKNFDDLTWLAKHRNISSFSLSSASTDGPTQKQDMINTHIVFTGADNGQPTGDCNNVTLLTNAAANGGTSLYTADKPEELKTKLTTALEAVVAGTASGTAASILSNSEGSGANLMQAVFYPLKNFATPTGQTAPTSATWIGEMQNLWYYVDPFISNSTVREDTDFSSTSPNHILNLKNDYAANFYFNTNQTFVELKQDTNGDGTGDTVINSAASPDDVKSIWRAGKQLWARTADSRTIHTSIDGVSLHYPTLDSKGGFSSGITRATPLIPYLQAADLAEAQKIINYVRGVDQTGYRNRTVQIGSGASTTDNTKVWKLGDIVTSTPRIQSTSKLNSYGLDSPLGYGDKSHKAFTASANYQKRGMVYVGANDGMLHAFKLGKLTVSGVSDVLNSDGTTYLSIGGDTKATLTGTNLGEEQWAYIPRNVLPYLKYHTVTNYPHIYTVDGQTLLADAAIGGCAGESDPANCTKDNTNGSNWRTVLIGSMGLGGSSRIKDNSCTAGINGTCVKTPILDPTDSFAGVGYSSVFAMDITGQYFSSDGSLANQPSLKWEFARPDLGFATSGAAIVKISSKKTVSDGTTTSVVADNTKNGKWFAIFASGPTGPINDTKQFMGKSDQNLKLFVVDLAATAPLVENSNYWVIDTGIKRAFGGVIINGVIDADRWSNSLDGNYQDDVIYVGYTKANIADAAPITADTTWTEGGVLRILTKEDPNPAHWVTSTLISGTGPVTVGVAKLQDRKCKKLWLYFGSGRYYYGKDDRSSQRYLFGVQDPCYKADNTIDKACSAAALGLSDLIHRTNTCADIGSNKGWYIDLGTEDPVNKLDAERLISDPAALTSGTIIFSSFRPTSDVCSYGGKTYLRAVSYNNGCLPNCNTLTGKALLQMSTGSFQQADFNSLFACFNAPRTTCDGNYNGSLPPIIPPTTPPLHPEILTPVPQPTEGFTGKGPPEFPIVTNSGNKPVKKILHIQEK